MNRYVLTIATFVAMSSMAYGGEIVYRVVADHTIKTVARRCPAGKCEPCRCVDESRCGTPQGACTVKTFPLPPQAQPVRITFPQQWRVQPYVSPYSSCPNCVQGR